MFMLLSVVITVHASQPKSDKIAQLEKVVTAVETYGPKVITEGKQIYTELQPAIQKIKQYLADKKAAKSAASLVTTGHATTTMTTTTTTSTSVVTTTSMATIIPPVISGASSAPVVQPANTIQASVKDTQEKDDKGKKKDNTVVSVSATPPVSALAQVSSANITTLSQTEHLSDDEVWTLVKLIPALYQFAQKYNISAQDLLFLKVSAL